MITPKTRAGGDVGVRAVLVRMVREVERFKPELQLGPLGELEVFVHREIQADDAGRIESAAAHISESSGLGENECAGVKEALRILLPARQRRILARRARPIEERTGVGRVQTVGHGGFRRRW